MSSVDENTCTEQSRSKPHGWVETTLGELIDIFNQKRVPLSTKVRNTRKGIYPYYGASNIVDYIDDYIFDGEYLLISEDGENLNTRNTPIAFIAKGKFWVNNHAHIVKGKETHLTKYLELYFSNLDISAYITGAVQPKLSKGNLINIPILISNSKEEQQAIAQILTAFDDKIELLQAQNNTLEQTAQTIFKEWFGKYQIGDELPEGWKEYDLGDVSLMSAGGDKPKNVSEHLTETNKIPIYSNGITNDGLYGYTDVAKIIDESVTVSARGTIGFVCLRMTPYVPIVRLVSIVPKSKFLSSKYLFFWLKSQNISGTGTTQQQLTVPDFKRTKIVIPTPNLMNKFTLLIDSFYDKININNSQIQTLKKTRDTLLPKLMSGQVRVNEFKEV